MHTNTGSYALLFSFQGRRADHGGVFHARACAVDCIGVSHHPLRVRPHLALHLRRETRQNSVWGIVFTLFICMRACTLDVDFLFVYFLFCFLYSVWGIGFQSVACMVSHSQIVRFAWTADSGVELFFVLFSIYFFYLHESIYSGRGWNMGWADVFDRCKGWKHVFSCRDVFSCSHSFHLPIPNFMW